MAARCPRCNDRVYHNEERLAAGKKWHVQCLKCPDCNKRLDSTTLTERDGEVYCKACYGRNFGPKGYGFAGGAAIMHTGYGGQSTTNNTSNTSTSNTSNTTTTTTNTAPPQSGGTRPNFCPGCGHNVQQSSANFCPNCGNKL